MKAIRRLQPWPWPFIVYGATGTATLYFFINFLWQLPSVELVLGMLAIAAFSGNLLMAKFKSYDGKMIVTRQDDGTAIARLEFEDSPKDLIDKASVTFKVLAE